MSDQVKQNPIAKLKVPNPAREANKLAGAYQCGWDGCGKGIEDGPMVEYIVLCGRSRRTHVWICVDHVFGENAHKIPAISDNLRSANHHRDIDRKRTEAGRAAVLASRFGDKATKPTDKIHDFQKENSQQAKRSASPASTFVKAVTLSAKLGIPPVAVAELVKSMDITLVTQDGDQCVKLGDFELMSAEVRRRTIGARRAKRAGDDENVNPSIEKSDDEFDPEADLPDDEEEEQDIE